MSDENRQPGNEWHQFNDQLLSAAEIYGLLDAYLTNELEAREGQAVRQHLAQCQVCRQTVLEIRQYHHLLRGVMPNETVDRQLQPSSQNHAQAARITAETFTPGQARQSGQLSSSPERPRKRPGRLQRTSTRLLIAAIILLLIGANLYLFRNSIPLIQQPASAHGTPTAAATHKLAAAGTTVPAPITGAWQHLWTLPALPPAAPGTYGNNPPYTPQFAWSPANPQRLYLCRATIDYQMPAILRDLYRSDDTGAHWNAYPMPETAANCRLQVDPTNADVLVFQDDKNNSFVSKDGAQHWQKVLNPPTWNTGAGVPNLQIVGGRLYAEGYWTEDLTHWTRWYPVAGEQSSVYLVVHAPHMLYTSVSAGEYHCAGSPQLESSALALCRSEDGGQTWHFLARLFLTNPASAAPLLCSDLNGSDALYAWGSIPGGPSGLLFSPDGGSSWQTLPSYFGGPQGSTPELNCNTGLDRVTLPSTMDAGTNTVPAATTVDVWQKTDNPADTYYSFALAPDGTIYHAGLYAVSDQGTALPAGISIFRHNSWQQIVPSFPVPVSITQDTLRLLLITPPGGAPFLLAYTDQDMYVYNLSKL